MGPKKPARKMKVQKERISAKTVVFSDEMIRSCGLVIFSNDLRSVLCISRTKFKYELPKGRIETGEDYRGTALRELQEEAGVLNAKDALEIKWNEAVVQRYTHREKKKEVYYFFA